MLAASIFQGAVFDWTFELFAAECWQSKLDASNWRSSYGSECIQADSPHSDLLVHSSIRLPRPEMNDATVGYQSRVEDVPIIPGYDRKVLFSPAPPHPLTRSRSRCAAEPGPEGAAYQLEVKDLLDMELRVLEALDFRLVVYHPYRAAVQ